jgi:hypothetical protein
MSADLYCWSPHLDLNPEESDFDDRVDELLEAAPQPPSPKLLAFLKALWSRYPDLSETEDTVWAAGPLDQEIAGDFIHLAVIWSRYVEARSFVIETANKHGLHCYDPQDDIFYQTQMP